MPDIIRQEWTEVGLPCGFRAQKCARNAKYLEETKILIVAAVEAVALVGAAVVAFLVVLLFVVLLFEYFLFVIF